MTNLFTCKDPFKMYQEHHYYDDCLKGIKNAFTDKTVVVNGPLLNAFSCNI
jgi:hypothetical protein